MTNNEEFSTGGLSLLEWLDANPNGLELIPFKSREKSLLPWICINCGFTKLLSKSEFNRRIKKEVKRHPELQPSETPPRFCSNKCYMEHRAEAFLQTNPQDLNYYFAHKEDRLEYQKNYIKAHQHEPEFKFRAFRNEAKSQKREFTLTIEDCKSLWENPCEYCGKIIDRASSCAYSIDRVDSLKGYIQGNVVACCLTCNRAKNALTLEDFKEWIKRVYTHLKLGNK